MSSSVTLASWNVNSVRARLDGVLAWLDHARPDVLCLQETKVENAQFPLQPFADLGYHIEIYGQKTFNGVAILSKLPLGDVRFGFGDGPDDPLDQPKRLISATVAGVRVLNLYAPNGQTPDAEAFVFKQHWYARLRRYLETHHRPDEAVLLCGDFNIAPADLDVHDPDKLRGTCGFHPDEHTWLNQLMAWGLVDPFRQQHPGEKAFSWWDYRENSFRRDKGMRIDYILTTPTLAGRCTATAIDRAPRGFEKPSDHTPVLATFTA